MKKLLLILLAVMMLTIPVSAAAERERAEEVIPRPSLYPEIAAEAKAALGPLGAESARAREAHELFLKNLNLDVDNMRFIYPDTFAGIWINGENLYIALTSNVTDNSWYHGGSINIFEGYEDIIIYETTGFNYSYNTLLNLQDIALSALREQGFSVENAWVSVRENNIYLNLTELDEEAVREALWDATVGTLTYREVYNVFVLLGSRGSAEAPIIINEPSPREENPRAGITLGLTPFLIAGGIIIISRKKK
ncbi:MAG: hypothetical protein FWD48_05635 [Oscillospiraceae bacterium]|nr:hypothetical protein [Oscillospiraceae bacterium]